jgi:hypothetical protein
MPARVDSAPALAAVDERRILELEQRSIRIANPTFQERELAGCPSATRAGVRPL